MHDAVLDFIKRFCGTEDCFLYGNCYWFAVILHERFGGDIYYDDSVGHFVSKIGNTYYDISGVYASEDQNPDFIYWDTYRTVDPDHWARIWCANL